MELSRARFRGTLTLDAPLDKKKKEKKECCAAVIRSPAPAMPIIPSES